MLAPPFHNQRGVALLGALILVMALVLIIGNIFYRHQIDVSQATQSLHRDQALLLALSGESWARQLLQNDDQAVDSFDELWAQAIPAMPVDGGLLNGCIADLQGRFNLNSFGDHKSGKLRGERGSENASFSNVWERLLSLSEIAIFPGRVEALIDWIDTDSNVVGNAGAEQDDYAGYLPPRMVANEKMAQPSELAAVQGYEIFEVQTIMPWITALPDVTQININTASDRLLMAIGGDFDLQFRDAVVANRPFNDMESLWDSLEVELAIEKDLLKARWPDSLLTTKTQYFQLYIEVLLGEARIEVRSIINRPTSGKPVILARDITTVPASLPRDGGSGLLEILDADMEDGEKDQDRESAVVQPACAMIGA